MEIFPVIVLMAIAGVLIYAVSEAIETLRSIDSGIDVLIGELKEMESTTGCLLNEVEDIRTRFIQQEPSVSNAASAALYIERYTSNTSLTLNRIESMIRLHAEAKM